MAVLTVTLTSVAQHANQVGVKPGEEPIYITLTVKPLSGKPVKLRGAEGGSLAYRFGDETFGLTPILRDRSRGIVEVRVFKITDDDDRVFKDMASVVANSNSSSVLSAGLPFRVELDSITTKREPVKSKRRALPSCGIAYCLGVELCVYCDALCDEDQCSERCGEMCGVSKR
jgi:hypothetical protein